MVLLTLNSGLFAQEMIPGISSVKGNQHVKADVDATRFDLDFSGGSAQELIAALSEASGTRVNALIPAASDQFEMPALKFYHITVAEVLTSLSYRESVPVIHNPRDSLKTSIQYRDIGYQWTFANNIWTMNVDALTPGVVLPINYVVHSFSIGGLLDTYTIDAITTTIDSAWKLNEASEENKIMFHPETKILLVKCPEYDMNILTQVLNTLYETIPKMEEKATKIKVSVLGEVRNPGNYVLAKGAKLTDAIAEAGGTSRMGNLKAVTLKLPNEKNQTRLREVNLSQILQGDSENIELTDGATIVVPERVI